jgi:CRP-like cAMP-binding protein
VLGQPRSADVLALTDVRVVEVDRFDFLYLLRGTDIAARLVRLARMRTERSWEVLERNSVIRGLTSAQKTQLQSFLEARPVRGGQVLWRAGDPAESAFVVDEGQVALEYIGSELAPFCSGALLGEFDALRQGAELRTTARALTDGRLLHIGRDGMQRFLRENPGVMVSFLGTVFVE